METPMNKFILMSLLLLSSEAVAGQLTTEEKVAMFYPNIVRQVQNHGLSGPIAHEVSKYAQLRCIHEDGPDRKHDVSYNGMVPGSPNKEVMALLYMPDCKLSKVSSNDGQGCYSITGPRAHVMASTAIALWYDMIINSTRICSDEEKMIWKESRWVSHRIAVDDPEPLYTIRFSELYMQRQKILRKINAAYGPQGEAIHQQKEKLWEENK
jgi:hypothetical protein